MKKEAAIVFGITSDYAFALANVLIGMKKHCKKFWDDIIIYHDGLSDSDKKLLNAILKCTFVDFNINELKKYNFNSHTIKTYSLMPLARFNCFNLLKKYKKVIWHDVDILVQSDFSGLMNYGDISGFATTMTDSNFYVESNFYKPVSGYSMYSLLYNSGIMVFSEKLKHYDKFTEWCFFKTKELASVIRYIDQGPINLLIQEFNIDVEKIDILKYCCHPDRKESKEASIIHAYGSNKFWNSASLLERFPEWQSNADEWLGTDKGRIITQKEKVSVIMSVYDRADYLLESIDSILNQTYSNFEIIIVVEYSNRQKEINDLIRGIKSDKIIVVNNEKKLGFAESLNIAIEHCTGDYIARMDDDDVSVLNRFEKQVDFLNKNTSIGICGGSIQCFGNCNDKWTQVPTVPEICKIQLLFCTALYHPTIMMRRDIIVKNNLFYNSNYFTEDYELWSRVIEYTEITNIPEVLLKYRVAGQNITSNNANKVHESHISVMRNQFIKYLKLDLSYDELQVINRRIIIPETVFNKDYAIDLQNKVYEKIIAANNVCKFYDKDYLSRYLNSGHGTKPIMLVRVIKKIARIVLKPIKVRFDSIYDRLDNLSYRIGLIEKKISKD